MWRILYMPEFEEWHTSLTNDEQDALDVRLELVSQRGPVLGRPYVDRVHQSRHHNMKEIRLPNGIRVLFAFDIRRSAVLLIGGNKSERDGNSPTWNRWYERMIPIADQIFDRHITQLRKEERND